LKSVRRQVKNENVLFFYSAKKIAKNAIRAERILNKTVNFVENLTRIVGMIFAILTLE